MAADMSPEPAPQPKEDFQIDQVASLIRSLLPADHARFLTDRLPEVSPDKPHKIKVLIPREIKAYLDRFVYGNESAKRCLSIAAYYHLMQHGLHYPFERVHEALKKHFTISRRQEDKAVKVVGVLTDEVRKNELNRRKGTVLHRRVSSILDAAVESGILKPITPEKTGEKKSWSRAESLKYRTNGFIDTLCRKKEPEKLNIKKQNVLILGSTGSGKTELLRTLSRCLNVPFVAVDATQFTGAGYEGLNITVIAEELLKKANGNKSLAEKGIVLVDEIDKVSLRDSKGHEVNSSDVQNSLLTILEDSRDVATGLEMSGVMFVLAGSFEGQGSGASSIGAIVRRRLGMGKIGFNPIDRSLLEDENIYKKVEPKDLMTFGFIKELVGRVKITHTELMTVDRLVDVLLLPEDSIYSQHRESLRANGVELSISEDGARRIAELAFSKGTGARALCEVLDILLQDVDFHAPDLTSDEHLSEIRLDGKTVDLLWQSRPQ